MKKKISLVLMSVLAMLLVACAPNNPTNSESLSDIVSESTPIESESKEDSESEKESTVESNSEKESEKESESESEKTTITSTYNSPNPDAKEVTIKTLLNLGSLGAGKGQTVTKTDTLYRIKGTVQFPFNTTYGNFDIVDETGSILVWGCCKSNSVLTKSGSTYSYTNNKSFSSIDLKAGDEIVVEGLYMAYTYSSGYFKPEFECYIISKTTGLVDPIEGKNYAEVDPYKGNYYSKVAGYMGNSLLKGLHNIMMETHTNYVSYDSLKSTLKKSDEYESTGQAKCFYTGNKTSSFTREHVWCQSLSGSTSSSSTNLYGTTHGGSDIHHIRPVSGDYNSKRSNAAFAPIYGPKNALTTIPYVSGQTSYISGNVMEPADDIKGDVARIVMYMYMHYSSSIAGDGNKYSFLGAMNIHYIMGPNQTESFQLLRLWNAIDPVCEDEIKRNEYAFQIQGNRNPFIDHPSYADLIWG